MLSEKDRGNVRYRAKSLVRGRREGGRESDVRGRGGEGRMMESRLPSSGR